MRRSALVRAELEEAVGGLSPAARAVFDDIRRTDEDARPGLPEGFDALTPPDRSALIAAAKLLEELAEAEAAEAADDQEFPEGVSRLRRRLWIVSVGPEGMNGSGLFSSMVLSRCVVLLPI